MDINEFNKTLHLKKVAFKWRAFTQNQPNLDFWTENDFLYFLDNEDAILKYSFQMWDEKSILLKDPKPELKLVDKQKLDRLREIYNERFKKIEPDDKTTFTLPERFKILEKLGLTESPIYKGLSETGKGHLIAKLLNISFDNGKKIKNGTYPIKDPVNDKKIDAFFEKFRTKN